MGARKLYSCVLYLIMFCISYASHIKQQYYVKTFDIGDDLTTVSSFARSSIHCAEQCLSREWCKSHSFSKDDKGCRLSTHGFNETHTGSDVYRRSCPIHLGFEFSFENGRTRCLKVLYEQSHDLTYPDAREACMFNNGHLFTMEDVNDPTTFYAKYPQKYYWIDGGESSTTWNGLPLPWENWLQPHPGVGYCTIITFIGYQMYSLQCDTTLSYICQIDV